jgi:hypothetical protein
VVLLALLFLNGTVLLFLLDARCGNGLLQVFLSRASLLVVVTSNAKLPNW